MEVICTVAPNIHMWLIDSITQTQPFISITAIFRSHQGSIFLGISRSSRGLTFRHSLTAGQVFLDFHNLTKQTQWAWFCLLLPTVRAMHLSMVKVFHSLTKLSCDDSLTFWDEVKIGTNTWDWAILELNRRKLLT